MKNALSLNYSEKSTRQLSAIYHNNSPLGIHGKNPESIRRHRAAYAELQSRRAAK